VSTCSKAEAAYQWYNYGLSKVPAGRTPLRANLDESSVCLYQGGVAGNIFVSPGIPAVENVSLGKRRRYMSHIAIICDVLHIQEKLPQFLVCNEHTIPAKEYAALRAAMPANVKLVRQRSAWNNTDLFIEVIRQLGAVLQPCAAEYTPIFSFDAAKIHLSPRVFAACRRAGLIPHLVAAKLTWALQPLDLKVFMPYKLQIQKEYQRRRLRSPDGVVDLRGWLESVCSAIRVVLQGRCWAAAFDSAGLCLNQVGVSDRTLRVLGFAARPTVGAAQPSIEQLRTCFPRRTKVPSKAIWRACELLIKPPGAKAKAAAGKAKALPPPPPPHGPARPVGVLFGPPRPPPPAPLARRSLRISAAAKAKAGSAAGVAPPVKAGVLRPALLAPRPPKAPPHA
jgi:hypothetical protein